MTQLPANIFLTYLRRSQYYVFSVEKCMRKLTPTTSILFKMFAHVSLIAAIKGFRGRHARQFIENHN